VIEVLPAGWAVVKLGDVHLDLSQTVNPAKTPDEVFELYSVPNFPVGEPESLAGREIGSSKQSVAPDTVLLCGINPRLSRVWVVEPRTKSRLIASTEWIPFFPQTGILPKYLAYFLRQHSVRDYLAGRASGVGGSLMRVKASTAGEFPFPVAPTPEQRRIVAEIEKQLTRLDAAVAALKRGQANLKRYRAAVLKAACEGRLVPTEAELARKEGRPYETGEQLLARILQERRAKWEAEQLARMLAVGKPPKDDSWKRKYKEPRPPDAMKLTPLPDGWAWASVDQAMLIIDYRGRTPPFAESGIPHLRSSNIRDGQILWEDLAYVSKETYEDYMTRGLPQIGDLLFTTEAPLGEVAGAPSDRIFSVAQRLMILRSSSSLILPKFLMYQIMGPQFQAAIRLSQTGSTVDGISSRNFRPVPVCIPPVSEQHRVVEAIERLLSMFGVTAQVLETGERRADRLRQSILKRAFEGKLVPQDPNDEPASVLLERVQAECAASAVGVSASRRRLVRSKAAEAASHA
jgi:type I restriction enzyme, S subunit